MVDSGPTVIHVDVSAIRENAYGGQQTPPIQVFRGQSEERGNQVMIAGPCRIVYRPGQPNSSGAEVWIETEAAVYVE